MLKKSVFFLLIVLYIFLPHYLYSGDSLFYKELNLIGGYSEEDEWIGKGQTLKNSLGFEYFKKFSNEGGDFLTADIQLRIAYDANEKFSNAWAIELHNAWLEYKLGLGKKIRAGHFTPAFGLETSVDTHGTLFQTLAGTNIGFKKDWGIEYRGIVKSFDYEIAITTGSGMGIERKDGSYLLSARIGKSQIDEFQYGLSMLYGEVLTSDKMKTFPKPNYLNETVLKKRLGVDVQYDFASFEFKSELAFGENDNNGILGLLLESNYIIPQIQQLKFTLQGQIWDNDLDESNTSDITLGVGASYQLNDDITLRIAYFHDIEAYSKEEDRAVLMQFYYFAL